MRDMTPDSLTPDSMTPDSARQAAKDLRVRHANLTGAELKHAHALELLASAHGYATWREFKTAISPITLPAGAVRSGDTTAVDPVRLRERASRAVQAWLSLDLPPELPAALSRGELMMDSVLLARAEDDPTVLQIGALKHDDCPTPFFDSRSDGELIDLARVSGDLPALLEAYQQDGHMPLLVEVYRHGLSHYALARTGGFPDRRWDVACPSHIYLPPDDIVAEYTAGTRDRDSLIAFVNGVLSQYSDYVNGDNWLGHVTRVRITPAGRIETLEEPDVVAVETGADNALAALADIMGVRQDPRAVPGV